MVQELGSGHHKWRLRSHFSSEAATTSFYHGSCFRVFADLPVPCSPRDMRQHPVGTGPFKFGAFKPNEYIKVARNADYWKQGRPYLDGIEYTIIKNLSTANLAFIAGTFDMTFPYALSAAAEGRKQADGAGDLRVNPHRRQPQLDRQSRCPAL